jgi:hypothetical protein
LRNNARDIWARVRQQLTLDDDHLRWSGCDSMLGLAPHCDWRLTPHERVNALSLTFARSTLNYQCELNPL